MIKPITLEDWKWIPTGDADFKTIKKNLEDIATKLNDTIDELNAERAIKTKFMRTVLMDSVAPITILEAGDHENLKIISGFAIAADSLKMEQTISIVNSANQALIESKTIKAPEKSGKAQSFEVVEWRTISKFDDVYVIPSSRRKVVVSLLLEEV